VKGLDPPRRGLSFWRSAKRPHRFTLGFNKRSVLVAISDLLEKGTGNLHRRFPAWSTTKNNKKKSYKRQ
jgi:hypothetical protein